MCIRDRAWGEELEIPADDVERLIFLQQQDATQEPWRESWSSAAADPEAGELLEAAPIVAAAEAHGVTPAQVVLRWHLHLDVLPLPKSADPERQTTNLEVLAFDLSEAEVEAITALGRTDGRLFGADPETHEEM